ncbi:MAG: hypothetical protein SYC29_14110 [Planctomycetota bacterium]|nr:hypothetical protein [Planctomycetota bacterium]
MVFIFPQLRPDSDGFTADDDSWWFIILYGIIIPLPFFIWGVVSIVRRTAVLLDRIGESVPIYGFNAVLFGLALVLGAFALHCVCFLSKMSLTWCYARLGALVLSVMSLACLIWLAIRLVI